LPAIIDEHLVKFLRTDLLGYYNQVEVTEIFAVNSNRQVINVYTLIAAEYKITSENHRVSYLTDKLIHIKGLPRLSFGVKQYTLKLNNVLKLISSNKKPPARLSSKLKLFSSLECNKPKFVPSDSTKIVPINRILKNNFFSGSYIFEWHDNEKTELKLLFDNPELLLQLSDRITKECINLKIASMSDRLGNIIFQIPVTALVFDLKYKREENAFKLSCHWNKKQRPRSMYFVYEAAHDGIILDKSIHKINNPVEYIPVKHSASAYTVSLIDQENNIILGASAQTSLLTETNFNMIIQEYEHRVFNIVKNGQTVREKVGIISHMDPVKIGESQQNEWTKRRKYNQEKEEVLRNNTFVESRPDKSGINVSRDVALNTVRNLINTYGERSVYILDPYLSANDIINTLFYCRHFGSILRGITSLEEPKAIYCPLYSGYYPGRILDDLSKTEVLIKDYRDTLNNLNSNYYGFNFELRGRRGNNGYTFHDRFLIFPETNKGPLAWSLGTSVNDIGKKHHIIQQVSNGQMVADSFSELWKSLDKKECIIWKKP